MTFGTHPVFQFLKKNPIIRILCISGWFAVPINPDKWNVLYFFLNHFPTKVPPPQNQ